MDYLKEFSGKFQKLSFKYDSISVFHDFLDMVICTFGMQRYEEDYLKTVAKYKKEEVNIFPELLATLVLNIEQYKDGGWNDLLGDFYMELGGTYKKWTGQYFTPPEICDMMAKMTYSELPEQDDLRINDPACGSGRTLIAMARQDPKDRFKMFFVAQDLDMIVSKMCVVNFVMFGMKGIIINMNSLSLEIFQGWRVYLPEVGLGVVKLSAEQCKQYVFTPSTQKEDKPVEAIKKPVQYTLNF